jgi:hypothetical protein
MNLFHFLLFCRQWWIFSQGVALQVFQWLWYALWWPWLWRGRLCGTRQALALLSLSTYREYTLHQVYEFFTLFCICTTLAGSTVFPILLGYGFCIKKPYGRWYSLAFVEPLACVGLILSQQIIPLICGDLCKLIKWNRTHWPMVVFLTTIAALSVTWHKFWIRVFRSCL